jgi:hypothetical protein
LKCEAGKFQVQQGHSSCTSTFDYDVALMQTGFLTPSPTTTPTATPTAMPTDKYHIVHPATPPSTLAPSPSPTSRPSEPTAAPTPKATIKTHFQKLIRLNGKIVDARSLPGTIQWEGDTDLGTDGDDSGKPTDGRAGR